MNVRAKIVAAYRRVQKVESGSSLQWQYGVRGGTHAPLALRNKEFTFRCQERLTDGLTILASELEREENNDIPLSFVDPYILKLSLFSAFSSY